MNKKYLMFCLPLLCIGLVVAGYYTIFAATFTVNQAITINGDLEQSLGEVYSGDEIVGSEIEIVNNALSSRTIILTDDSDENINVQYSSTLSLSQKIVDFGADVWDLLPEGNTAIVEYTLIGDEFTAEVIEGEIEGYVLVYYKDNSDRFNSPAKAIVVENVEGNLPYEDDANADEYNYCETGEYATCHGAKIWYVPQTAVDESGNVNWGQASDFLFETKLIQFNSDSQIIIYSESNVGATPIYEIGNHAEGEYTITTTVA